MLIIGRKEGERIIIDTPQGRVVVSVELLRDPWGNVRLGFTAPREIPIRRLEHVREDGSKR